MLRRLNIDSGYLSLVLVLWLCSLPLMALLIVPILGPKVGAIVAVALLFVAMAICWGICGWKVYQNHTKDGHPNQ